MRPLCRTRSGSQAWPRTGCAAPTSVSPRAAPNINPRNLINRSPSSTESNLFNAINLINLINLEHASLIDLEQDQRHVVVRPQLAGEIAHLAQDPLAQLVKGQLGVVLDVRAQSVLAEQVF